MVLRPLAGALGTEAAGPGRARDHTGALAAAARLRPGSELRSPSHAREVGLPGALSPVGKAQVGPWLTVRQPLCGRRLVQRPTGSPSGTGVGERRHSRSRGTSRALAAGTAASAPPPRGARPLQAPD